MSDIGISYNASTSPSRVGGQIGIQFEGTTLRASIRALDNFAITLTPGGNVSEQILSGVAWPIAQSLGAVLPSLGRNLVVGRGFNLITISSTMQTIEGETVTISAGNLRLDNFNGMLMAHGTVSVS
jgi:hypothetical protein